MCGIVGLAGNFQKELLFSMMESVKHRGEDSSGFYLHDGEESLLCDDFDVYADWEKQFSEFFIMSTDSASGSDCSESSDCDSANSESSTSGSDYSQSSAYEADKIYSIGLGHNLLSVFSLLNDDDEIISNIDHNRQPIATDNIILVFNGELYNFNKLNSYLKSRIDLKNPPRSDSELLACLIKYFYITCGNDLLCALKDLLPYLDGDYSFAAYDLKSNNLAVCRDQIGVKPLFYGSCDSFSAFASERKALWKAGIDDCNIKDLSPGTILYNFEEVDMESSLIDRIFSLSLADKNEYESYNDYISLKDSYDVCKELLCDDLKSAVFKRVENVSDVGLIFSGGVDSTILAVILKEIADERRGKIEKFNGNEGFFEGIVPLNITLYSVGVENSQDIKFSRRIADDLGLDLKTVVIDEKIIKDNVANVLTAIEDDNVMKLGVGMTIYLAAEEMKKDGIRVALSGQGADELFGGYNRYLKHFENNSLSDAYFALDEEIRHDIANMHHVNLERDDAVAMANGVELRVPFLDEEIIDLALDIPAKYKIRNSEDVLRKHILRDAARDLGVPDYIADRPKKAAQYGTGINKILKKKVLRQFDIKDFVNSLKEN